MSPRYITILLWLLAMLTGCSTEAPAPPAPIPDIPSNQEVLRSRAMDSTTTVPRGRAPLPQEPVTPATPE